MPLFAVDRRCAGLPLLLQQQPERIRDPEIVPVEENDPVPGCDGQAEIARDRDPLAMLGINPDPGVFGCVPARDFW